MAKSIRITVLAVVALIAATSCQVGVTMFGACSPAADGNPFGTDGTYVLVCEDGEWEPVMTVLEYIDLVQGKPVTIAPLPADCTDTPGPGVYLRGCDLSGVDYSHLDLTDADFNLANLNGASLKGADLTGALLAGANLTSADLDDTDLTGASFWLANLSGTTFLNATWSDTMCFDGRIVSSPC